jgi:hypothetical protein
VFTLKIALVGTDMRRTKPHGLVVREGTNLRKTMRSVSTLDMDIAEKYKNAQPKVSQR